VAGCLIDLDGTIYQGESAIDGAREAIDALRRAGVPFRFTTNTTRRPRSALVFRLERLGIDSSPEEYLTAPGAAASFLREVAAQRLMLLLARETYEEFAGFEIDLESPEWVVVGDLGEDWSFEVLDRAFRALMAGAELVAIQKNRYWQRSGQLTLDAGPFVAALEYASGKAARLVGKPSREFFEAAARELDLVPESVFVVGDDVETDIAGAQAAGLAAIAVRTGKFRPEDEARAEETAVAVLDSIAELPAWLGL
jgi:HAD superfamily hydrolase (TIGR01458 family)